MTPQPDSAPGAFPATLRRTARVYADCMGAGHHRGIQFRAVLNGRTVADVALGEAGPDAAMTRDTLMPWRSCSKPVAAVAIAQLWERGLLHPDRTVASFIPGFATGGKAGITIRHLLTHTAGIRRVPLEGVLDDWDAVIRRIAGVTLEPDWQPGRRAAYHVRSSWYLLGEIVRIADGRPFDRYVREEIFLPLAMPDCWVGMPGSRFDAYGPRIGVLWDTFHQPPRPDPGFSRDAVTQCSPGSSGIGPMAQLARLYEALLRGGELDGRRILNPQTVEALTARHRVGLMDETFMHGMDWGLGFIMNSNRHGAETVPYGFGRHASARAFGHGGSQSSGTFADPEAGLVVAVVFNGIPGDARHSRRIRNFCTALYEDLGLTP